MRTKNRSSLAAVIPAVLLGLLPASAAAQTTLDPTKTQFTASSAQNATLADGTPVVQYYQLDLYLLGASAPFQSVNLGKPTPDATNTITVDLKTIFTGWPLPGTTYVADIAAVGPGGTAPSALSNTFAFSTQCAATVTPLSQQMSSTGGAGTASVTAT